MNSGKQKHIFLHIVTAVMFMGLGAASVSAAYAGRKTETPAPAAMETGIGALGRIEPRSRVISLSHNAGPEGARIETLNVIEGQEVSPGDIIATFSDYGLKEAKLASARAAVPVLTARLRAEEAKKIFDKGERDRGEELLKGSAVSKVRLQELELNYKQSQATAEALQAEIESASADILVAEKELERSRIVAPAKGTILKIHSWPGERISDKGVAEMADLTAMDVVAEIYERDMPRVKPGQKAEIRVPAFDAPFTGEVRELGYQVMKNDLNATDPLADRDNRVVEVRITLSPDVIAKIQHLIYMQVDVRIHE